jgi:hypothetical protein
MNDMIDLPFRQVSEMWRAAERGSRAAATPSVRHWVRSIPVTSRRTSWGFCVCVVAAIKIAPPVRPAALSRAS